MKKSLFFKLLLLIIFLLQPVSYSRYQEDEQEDERPKREREPIEDKTSKKEIPKKEITPEEVVSRIISSQYKNEQYFDASVELFKLTKIFKDDKLLAKIYYYIGRSLVKTKLIYSSVPFFQKAVTYNDGLYSFKSLNALFKISDYLKEDSYIHKTVEKLNYEQLPLNQKAEINYYEGKALFNENKYDDAIAKLKQVFPGTEFFFKSRYFLGMIYYNSAGESFEKKREALKYFREVTESNDIAEKDFEIQGLSFAAVGRINYELAQFNEAISNFRQVKRETSTWIESIFDIAWAYFMADNHQKALGAIHVLHSPYYENIFNPESYLLKVIIFFTNCWYSDALKSIEEYLDRYGKFFDFVSSLKPIIQKMDDLELYEQILKKRNENEKNSKYYEMLFNFLLTEKKFKRYFSQLQTISAELNPGEEIPKEWNELIYPLLKKKLEKKLEDNKRSMGALIKNYISKAEELLGDYMNQAKIIKFEILNSQKDKLEASLRVEGERRVESRVKNKDTLIEEGYEFWPFTGEYWFDEMGFFIYNLINICQTPKE